MSWRGLEEMRRTLAFLAAKRRWWISRSNEYLDSISDEAIVSSGLKAYASKQANLCHALANNFAHSWFDLYKDAKISLPISWPKEYLSPSVDPKRIKRRRERVANRRKLIALLGSESENEAQHS